MENRCRKHEGRRTDLPYQIGASTETPHRVRGGAIEGIVNPRQVFVVKNDPLAGMVDFQFAAHAFIGRNVSCQCGHNHPARFARNRTSTIPYMFAVPACKSILRAIRLRRLPALPARTASSAPRRSAAY